MEGVFEVARPRVFNHLFKGLIFGGIGGLIVFLVVQEATEPAGYIFALFAYPFVAAFTRNVQAFFARPHFRLTHEQIQLRYWRPVDFPSFAMFLPMYRIVDRSIPWAEYATSRTYKYTVNGLPRYQAFILESKTEDHPIGWDIFSKSVNAIQGAFLDYIEIEFRQPLREQSGIVEFCKTRFAQPARVESSTGLGPPLICVLLTLGSCGLLMVLVPEFPDTGWVLVPFLLALGAIGTFYDWTQAWGKRVLELRSEGLAIGDSFELMRVVPWEDILFVRAHTKLANDQSDKGTPEALEIRLRDRSSILLRHHYRRTLADLQELIDPPLAKLEEARRRAGQGEEFEAACTAAGLPGRS